MSKKHYPKLDIEEQELSDSFDKGEWKSMPQKKLQREKMVAKKAGINYFRKEQRITIRVNSSDLQRIKMMAAEEGLPYQTFISSMLHKLSTGRLHDVKEGRF